MDEISVFPDKKIENTGVVSKKFLSLDINTFQDACRYVHQLPYGYNSNKDDVMVLFKEKMGTCTTKHMVIATLAREMHLPVTKTICIYAMTEEIVTGTDDILNKYDLPYVPMIHCFLEFDQYRVDLTEGNNNGKNRSIEEFLYTQKLIPNITAKDEYRLYRQALTDKVLSRGEMAHADMKTVLHAREEGVTLLKANICQ
jgi:hypothetical protein